MDAQERQQHLENRATRLQGEHYQIRAAIFQILKKVGEASTDPDLLKEHLAGWKTDLVNLKNQAKRLEVRMLRCRASLLELTIADDLPVNIPDEWPPTPEEDA